MHYNVPTYLTFHDSRNMIHVVSSGEIESWCKRATKPFRGPTTEANLFFIENNPFFCKRCRSLAEQARNAREEDE